MFNRHFFPIPKILIYFLSRTQHACAILSYSVEIICFVSPSESPNTPSDGSYPETKYLLAGCRKIQNELTKCLPTEQSNQKTITNRHTELILNQLEVLMQMPICMPRFFFQVLQNTSIKLSISPQPRVAGDPVVVQQGSSLVVKVEGVIQHYAKTPSLYRSVESVQLTLTSQLISPKANDFKMTNDTTTLTQTVKPHRDFLTGNFMIPLTNIQPAGPPGQFNPVVPTGGQWQLTLEACVIDGDSVVWNTGPKSYVHFYFVLTLKLKTHLFFFVLQAIVGSSTRRYRQTNEYGSITSILRIHRLHIIQFFYLKTIMNVLFQ